MIRLLLSAMIVMVLAGPAIVFGQSRERLRVFRLSSLTGTVEMGYELETADRSSPGSQRKSRTEERSMVAGLNADLAGSILHPSLFSFRLGGTLRVRRTDVNSTSSFRQGRRNFDDSQYRLFCNILNGFRWSGEIGALRFQQDNDSTFSPRRLVVRKEEFAAVRRKSSGWPVQLMWRRARATGLAGDPRDETRERVSVSVNHRSRDVLLRADADSLDYGELSSRQEYTTKRFNAGLTWMPKGGRKFLSNTTLLVFDRVGSVPLSQRIANQRLVYRPAQNLRINGVADWQLQEDEIGKREVRRASVGLNHVLWGSLVSRLIAGVEDHVLPLNGALDRKEIEFGFDYTRNLPKGRLRLGWSRGIRRDEEEFPGGGTPVSEQHDYDPGSPIFLDLPRIDRRSIRVTNPSGTLVFVEGIDYELLPSGELIELVVLTGGNIHVGDTLHVIYFVLTSGFLDLRLHSRGLSAGWRGNSGLMARYTRRVRLHDVLGGFAGGRIDDVNDTEYQAGLRRRRFGVKVSQRDRQSDILAYRSRQVGANWDVLRLKGLQVSLRARVRKIIYPDRQDDARFASLGVDLRYRVGRFQLGLIADRWNETILGREGRYLRGNLVARVWLREVELVLRWHLRDQTIALDGRDDRQELVLMVRRRVR